MIGRRWSILCVALALAPTVWLIWAARDFPQLGRLDDGFYWTAARSLAEGREYRIESLPEQPYQTKYPPLYPLLLSVAWRLGSTEQSRLAVAALLQISLVVGFVAVAWYVVRGLVSPRLSFVLAVFFAVCPAVALVATNLLADLPFAILVLIATGLAARASSKSAAFAAGVVAGFAYLTKTAALPLAVVLPVTFALRRRYAWAVLAAAGMLPAFAGWHWWTHVHRSNDPRLLYYTDYLGYYLADISLRDLPAIARTGAFSLLRAAGSLISLNVHDSALAAILGLACAALAFIGILDRASKWIREPYPLFCAVYAVILVTWNYPPDERLALPLLPLIAVGLGSELVSVGRALGPRTAVIGAAALFAFWGFITVGTFARRFPQQLNVDRQLAREREQAFEWITANLPKSAMVHAHYQPLLFLRTGRRGTIPMVPPSAFYRGALASGARSMLADSPTGYYMITTNDHWFAVLPPEMKREILSDFERPPFRQLYRSGSTVIVRRDGRSPSPRT